MYLVFQLRSNMSDLSPFGLRNIPKFALYVCSHVHNFIFEPAFHCRTSIKATKFICVLRTILLAAGDIGLLFVYWKLFFRNVLTSSSFFAWLNTLSVDAYGMYFIIHSVCVFIILALYIDGEPVGPIRGTTALLVGTFWSHIYLQIYQMQKHFPNSLEQLTSLL